MKEFQKEITILKRTTGNYSHKCIIDDTIVSIQAWRRSKHKFQLFLILHLFTLGIIHLISLFIPSLYLKMYFKRSSGLMADFFLITDKNNREHLVKLEKIPLESKNSYFSNFYKVHFGNDALLRVFKFLSMTYIYREDNCVYGLYIDFTKYRNNEIHSFMTEGMDTENYKEHRKALGKNINVVPEHPIYRYFYMVEIPMNFLILVSAIIYFAFGNYVLASIYIFFIVVIVIVKIVYKKLMLKRIPLDVLAEGHSTLSLIMSSMKKIEKKVIQNIDVIPGDFLVLKKGQTVPCDCLLLEGDCVVNENSLFGKTSVTRKTHLPKDDKDFNYAKNQNSILYQSSIIVKCHSSVADNKSIIVIALNTGSNTLRSNQYSSTHIDNPFVIETLYYHKKLLFFSLLLVLVISVGTMMNSFLNNDLSKGKINRLVEYVIRLSMIIFFPLYHISLFFISFFCIVSLRKEKVECVDESKLEVAGKITTIVFDKTGTLSEEVLIISGFQPVNYDGTDPVIAPLDDKEAKKLKFNHLKFWKDYKKSSVSFKCNNKTEEHSIYYLHCLVTCHNLEKINNENCGALLEKELLKTMKWELNAIKMEVDDDINPEGKSISIDTIEIYPKNYYKITEKDKFDQFNQTNKIFKLLIYTRFMSLSSSQGISSIVKNTYDNSLRFFCKGQPEDILPKCLPSTLPKDIETVLINHRKNGYRIIVCATKDVDSFSFQNKEEYYMNNLTFLGFILLKNNLRKETKKVIDKLKKMDLELIMATGDSIHTSLSVAYESNFISDKNIYVLELEKNQEEENKRIRITYLYQKAEEKQKLNEDSISFSGRRLLNESSHIETGSKILFHRINQFVLDIDNLEVLNPTKHNSLYCLSGETFHFIYEQFKKEKRDEKTTQHFPYTKLIRYVKHLCKIYFFMSAENKVELIEYFRTIPDKVISMVGDGVNDLSAMMKSNVGISLKKRRLCHFYSMDNSLECVEKIIKAGRATRENYLSLLLFYILACSIEGLINVLIYSIGSQLNNIHYITLELLILLSSCLAFQIIPDYTVNSNPLYLGSYFSQYSVIKVVGHIAIKFFQSVAFFFLYDYNPLIEDQIISRNAFGSYLYLLACENVISSVIGFNIDAISRVNNLGNNILTFFLTLMEFYLISLATLTSWNFHSGIFNLLPFVSLIINIFFLGIPEV